MLCIFLYTIIVELAYSHFLLFKGENKEKEILMEKIIVFEFEEKEVSGA